MRNLPVTLGGLVIALGVCKSGALSGPVARNSPSLLLVPYYTTIGDVWSSRGISVYKIDASTGNLRLVTGSPFAAGSEPTAAALAPDGRFAYVVNKQSGSVSAYTIDARTEALRQVPGSPVALSDFSSEPVGIVVDPPGSHAYAVSNAGISGFLIDAVTGALTPMPGSPFGAEGSDGGNGTASIAIDPANRFAYVLNSFRGTVSSYAIDAAGALKLAGTPVDADLSGNLTIDPRGKFAYVTARSTCCIKVYAIDATSGALTPSAQVRLLEAGLDELGGFAIDPAGKFAYAVVHKYADVGSRVYAYSIDAANGGLKALDHPRYGLAAGSDPYGLTIDPTGTFAYAFNRGSPSAAITIYGYRIDPGGQLTPLARSPFTAAAITTDPVARWFNAGRCAAFGGVPEGGAHSPPAAKRDSDLVFDHIAAATPGYFYDSKRRVALHYPFGDAGGTITLQEAGEPPRGVLRRDLGGLQTSSGIKLGSHAKTVVRALGEPKIISACNEQAYFYVTPGGMPLLLQFTIRKGVVVGISEERGG